MTAILRRRRPDRGFTLLEIVISMGLIATALLAVFRLQAQNLDFQSEAQFITDATYLAQDRISRIQAEEGLEAGILSGDFGEDFPHFGFREEISEMTDTENVFRIEVVISSGEGNLMKDFSVVTYIYRAKQ